MAIAGKVSSAELTAQVSNRFASRYCEARLINAPGTTYTPGVTSDATFLAAEVVSGTGGYARQTIKYEPGDVNSYNDDGVALTTKATVFAHDGGETAIDFSHVALVWSTGNVTALGAVTAAPAAGVDGIYTNIPIDSTSGSGEGLTVDLTIQNSGAVTTDYVLTLASYGRGYAGSDTLTIADGTLAGLGAITGGAGDLVFPVSTVATDAEADNIISVAQTTSAVSLTAGNEAAFYWNLKLFGIGNT